MEELSLSVIVVEELGGVCALELAEIGKVGLLGGPMDDSRIMRWLSGRFDGTKAPKRPVYSKTTQNKGSAKQRRRQRYALVQTLWKKDMGAVARVVLEENDLVATKVSRTQQMFEYWKEVFAVRGGRPEIGTSEYLPKSHMEPLWWPVTLEEIKASRVSNDKGAGPDGIKPRAWNALDDRYKRLLYNLFIVYDRVPESIKGSRTVFTPKVDGGSNDPGDFRPLSICSVVIREFNKILSKRFAPCYESDERQTAYLPIDGVCINVSLLTTIIAEAKILMKELHIAILDLIKAFNSVYSLTQL